jgi:hypothetical protein
MRLDLNTTALPTLASHCLLIGHGQKADVVWTETNFVVVCDMMRNGNDAKKCCLKVDRA